MKIKIVGVPTGEAPKEVREQWVGCVLEAKEKIAWAGYLHGPNGGYQVPIITAIETLQQKSPEAAQWYDKNVFPFMISYLDFDRASCEVLRK